MKYKIIHYPRVNKYYIKSEGSAYYFKVCKYTGTINCYNVLELWEATAFKSREECIEIIKQYENGRTAKPNVEIYEYKGE